MKRLLVLRATLYAFAILALGVSVASAQSQVYRESGSVKRPIWSGYWWPNSNRSILGPLQKYDMLTGLNSAAWKSADLQGPSVEWAGLCHGFAAASAIEPEPKQPINVTYQGRSVHLSVGDQKGLLTAAHDDDTCDSIGSRYDGGPIGVAYNDVAPVHLWAFLRKYVRNLGRAIVVDAYASAPVWNYPVYRYRITVQPYQAPNLHFATLEILMADDAVLPDFVGIQPIKKTYYFTVRKVGSQYDPNSGRWYGPSRTDHPDFAWIPTGVATENPHLSPKLVRDFLRVTEPRPEPPTPNVAYGNEEEDEDDENVNEPANDDVNSENAEETRVDDNSETGRSEETELFDNMLDYETVVGLIENEKSSFKFDVSVAGLKRFVPIGDDLKLTVRSERAGYLYLFVVDPEGEISCLYPLTKDAAPIPANELVELPGNVGYSWRVSEPVGQYLVKGIVLERPLAISGAAVINEVARKNAEANANDDKLQTTLGVDQLRLRVPPSFKEAARYDLESTQKFIDALGAFAHDEETIYVGDPENVGAREIAH